MWRLGLEQGLVWLQKIRRGEMLKHFDLGSLSVISITFSLFAAALFFKGLKHDMLLEAGVFLTKSMQR
jgi:hypothetical protein